MYLDVVFSLGIHRSGRRSLVDYLTVASLDTRMVVPLDEGHPLPHHSRIVGAHSRGSEHVHPVGRADVVQFVAAALLDRRDDAKRRFGAGLLDGGRGLEEHPLARSVAGLVAGKTTEGW